ncbi:MAG TPA: GYF domain-containing protein [Lysobacter sp.]
MDWYYHDPGQGRVGPLSAEELRNRYRDRRIQADTLVWRDGMREWQPLERMGGELDLRSVTPDASRPPPLPPGAPAAMPTHVRATGQRPSGYARPAPPERRMSGCLIALLVGAGLSVPLLGILAAIAVPAYRDYTIRAKLIGAADTRAAAIAPGIEAARERLGRCPDDAREAGLGAADGIEFGEVDGGRCAFRITLRGVHPEVDGRTVVYAAPADAGQPWDCTGGDLPARYRRPQCRSGDE